jgi:hypothetical protein
MQNHVRRLIAVAVLAAVLAGCQSIPALGSMVPGSGPLVSVTLRGGECPEGPCGSTTVIERDGRVHQTAPVAAEIGALTGDLLTALDVAVATADFAAIRARPFTGECPVNFDGQETIYEFGAPGGTQRIATCETDIDPNHPLFQAVIAAISSVVAEPG